MGRNGDWIQGDCQKSGREIKQWQKGKGLRDIKGVGLTGYGARLDNRVRRGSLR